MSDLPVAFHRLAWSNLAAQSAEQIGLAAVPIVAVLAMNAGPGATGLLQTAQTLPFLLLSIPAGLLVDRTSRRTLMAAAEGIRLGSLLAILILAALDQLTFPLLAALGFIGATGTVAYSVAAPSLIPALVPARALADANGRIELARTIAFAAGPALAGGLVGGIGAAPAFGLAAFLSALAACLLAGIREPARPAAAPRAIIRDLREGTRFTLTHPHLRPILLTAVFFNTAFFVLQGVYAPYAIGVLGLSAAGVGLTLAAYGVGMVIGALFASRVLRVLPFGVVIGIGPVSGLAASLLMLLTIAVPSPFLAGLSFFLLGAGPVLWVISTTTLRQIVTPADLLGRVSAVIMTATYGARPIGAAIGAFAGSLWGVELCLAVSTAGFFIQALVILASSVPRLTHQPEMAA